LKNHFDQHLNIRKLMIERRPELVIECGAGNGECTRLLAHMLDNYPFDLHVISDKIVLDMDDRIEWKIGISYRLLRDYDFDSIGMVIIDTDHNYWTLQQELEAVAPRMKEGGLILLHDVQEFYHNTGMAMGYWNGESYPEETIMEHAKFGGLGDAMVAFLAKYNNTFKLLAFSPEAFGAAAIEKKTIENTSIVRPGTKPVFAPPVGIPA